MNMGNEVQINAKDYLQNVIDIATSKGVFDKASDAAIAQSCLDAINKRVEDLVNEVEDLKLKVKNE
jgi:hypothetical protein